MMDNYNIGGPLVKPIIDLIRAKLFEPVGFKPRGCPTRIVASMVGRVIFFDATKIGYFQKLN